MKISFLILSVLTAFSYSICLFNPKADIGERIGFIQHNNLVFSIDTTQYKNYIENNVINSVSNVRLDKIEILKSRTYGDSLHEFYMIIAYDKELNLKNAHWLVKEQDSLYFFKNKSGKDIPHEIFYGTFFTCYGSEASCFPLVRYYDNKYSWGTSEKLLCSSENECKAIRAFVFSK